MEPEKNITETATKMTMLAVGSKSTNNDGTDEERRKAPTTTTEARRPDET